MNPAYRTAVFSIQGELPPDGFSIVTAYNPEGQVTDPSTNQSADIDLRSAIQASGETPARITGMSPDRSHKEPGWSVRNHEQALRLARKFRQIALYRVDSGSLWLVETKTGKAEELGSWKNFLAPQT
ncbi:MAG: DUF3293 domain-containing protein [Puniceicoccales bacterium]